MKKTLKQGSLFCAIVLVVLAGFLMAGCDNLPFMGTAPGGDGFVAVTDITGIHSDVAIGSYTLKGTVSPSSATNKNIAWSVYNAGETKAAIDGGNVLITKEIGTVMVKATVANGKAPGTDYTKTFIIDVIPRIVEVNRINGIPSTLTVGSHTLSGTVSPSNASRKDISWEITDRGTTGAVIRGNLLDTLSAGTLSLEATIYDGKEADDYTQNFTIAITAPNTFTAVTNITNLPVNGPVGNMTLTGTVVPTGATHQLIIWTVESQGATAAGIPSGSNTLRTTGEGTVKVRATIKNGDGTLAAPKDYTQVFDINIGNTSVAVTDITPSFDLEQNVDSADNSAFPLIIQLGGTVKPDNVNKTIVWKLEDDGNPAVTLSGAILIIIKRVKLPLTVKVKATITNGLAEGIPYTQVFSIVIKYLPVLDITIKRSDVSADTFKFSVDNDLTGTKSYRVFDNAGAPIKEINASSGSATEISLTKLESGLNSNERQFLSVQAFDASGKKTSSKTEFKAMLKYANSSDFAQDWYDFLRKGLQYIKEKDADTYDSYSDLDGRISKDYCSTPGNKGELEQATAAVIACYQAFNEWDNEDMEMYEAIDTTLFRLWFNKSIAVKDVDAIMSDYDIE